MLNTIADFSKTASVHLSSKIKFNEISGEEVSQGLKVTDIGKYQRLRETEDLLRKASHGYKPERGTESLQLWHTIHPAGVLTTPSKESEADMSAEVLKAIQDLNKQLAEVQRDINNKIDHTQNELRNEISTVKSDLKEDVSAIKENVDHISDTVTQLDKTTGVLEERTKDIATQAHVSSEIHSTHLKILVWIVGTGLTVGAMTVSIVKLL